MASIATISPARATGETAAAYAYMRRVVRGGVIAKVVQIFSLRPDSMRRMIRSWELTQWVGSEPRAQREFVAAAVSRLNHCHY
jgi:hypothetical protein